MKTAKRFLSVLLSLCLVLSLIPGTAFAASGNLPFTDVNTTDWYHDAVQYVYGKGMMSGTSATAFAPNETTSRGMIVTVLHRMEGMPTASGAVFTDVSRGQWYADAVAWANANNIVGGYGNGLFGPGDAITREQMSSILYRYSQYKGYPVSAAGSLSAFPDAAQTSSYAVDAMNWAVGSGLIAGVSGNLDPKGSATRAQVATILRRYCENVIPASTSAPDTSMPDTIPTSSTVDTTYTVTFDLNYGSDTQYDRKTVKAGETVSKPSNPSRSGYSFGGWYAEKSGGSQFDFKKGITSDLTLYAHWSKRSSGGSSGGGGSYIPPSTTYYTVTFYMNDGTDAVHTTATVAAGNSVSTPAQPVRDGYSFHGWYTDAAAATAYSFGAAVTGNLALYAKWTAHTDSGDGYTVTFDRNDDSVNTIYQSQTVAVGNTATQPAISPTREMYRFTGWYTEPEAVVTYDFSTPVEENITLYAGWGNPDGSEEGVYAYSENFDTIYSITGIDMTRSTSQVTVTYNTRSACTMVVDFLEDNFSADWNPSDSLGGAVIASVTGQTADYGELITLTLSVPTDLPQYYIVRAYLADDTGAVMRNEDGSGAEYVSFEYTQLFEQFDNQTVDDVIAQYGEDRVINFDSDRTTNFGVLRDGVTMVDVSILRVTAPAYTPEGDEGSVEAETEETTVNAAFSGNILEIKDIYSDSEQTIPDQEYTFFYPDEVVSNLAAGDVVYVKDTSWMFRIADKRSNADGSITLIPDETASMEDFYDVLQVNMDASDAPVARWEVVDVDTDRNPDALKLSISPSISKSFNDNVSLTGKLNITLKGHIKLYYDLHIFSEDYMECAIIVDTDVSANVKVSVSDNNSNEWKNVVYQYDTRPIKLPTPVTGLKIYGKPIFKIDWSLTGEVGVTVAHTETLGFRYNSRAGANKVCQRQNRAEIMAKGSATAKVGPILDIGVEFLEGVVSGGLVAGAGAKFTAEAVAKASTGNNPTEASEHACNLCVNGKAQWYAEVTAKLKYKITDSLKGDIASLDIFKKEGDITFLKGKPGKFFISVINDADSPFGGHIKFGGGDCINKVYRTTIETRDIDGTHVEGILVNVQKYASTGGRANISGTGNSPYTVYLYPGKYTASATIDSSSVSKDFTVKDSSQSVTLQARQTGDCSLNGRIIEADTDTDMTNNNPLPGATVTLTHQDTGEMARATTGSDGNYELNDLMAGTYTVEVTKTNYIPISQTLKIEANQVNTYNATLELISEDYEGEGTASGTIIDVLTGQGVSGLTLNVRKGIGVTTGAVDYTTYSGADGKYQTANLPAGNYTVEIKDERTLLNEDERYNDSSFTIKILGGMDIPNQNGEVSNSLTVDQIRIVLRWGEQPRDLDSHLVGPSTTGGRFHTYYSNKTYYADSTRMADLDLDDVTSYGPETTTIYQMTPGIYTFLVHDYTNRNSSSSTAMGNSGAYVRVYLGASTVAAYTFYVPSGGGTVWTVFSYDSNTGTITPINTMSYQSSPGSVGSNYQVRDTVAFGDEPEYGWEPVEAPLKDYEIAELQNSDDAPQEDQIESVDSDNSDAEDIPSVDQQESGNGDATETGDTSTENEQEVGTSSASGEGARRLRE